MTEYISREILLVMHENKISKQIVSFLTDKGFIVTLNSNEEQIFDLLANKFFIVACFDLDTPGHGSGILFLKKAKQLSPLTNLFILSARSDFNALLASFRLGAKDFILLKEGYQHYLIKKITKNAINLTYQDGQTRLMKKMLNLHSEFFKRMVSLHIKYMECQQSMLDEVDKTNTSVSVLVVDDDSSLSDRLLAESSIRNWNLLHLDLGGSALEHGASRKFDIALVKYSLPDLPGSMVASALTNYHPNIFIIMYSLDHDKVTLHQDSVVQNFPKNIDSIDSLIKTIIDQATNIKETRTKKQHLQSFKVQHFDFLKKYNEIKNQALKVLKLEKEVNINE